MVTDTYLKVDELEIGQAYEVEARNFSIAIWNGSKFAGLRYKFGDRFIDYELHWDTDTHFGTVKPIRKLT